jgi:hypothetical protein
MSEEIERLAGKYILGLATANPQIELTHEYEGEDLLWFLTCKSHSGIVRRYKGLTVTAVLKCAAESDYWVATEGNALTPAGSR